MDIRDGFDKFDLISGFLLQIHNVVLPLILPTSIPMLDTRLTIHSLTTGH